MLLEVNYSFCGVNICFGSGVSAVGGGSFFNSDLVSGSSLSVLILIMLVVIVVVIVIWLVIAVY